jgi:hypothetical protein
MYHIEILNLDDISDDSTDVIITNIENDLNSMDKNLYKLC